MSAVASVTCAPPEGTYSIPQTVILSTETAGATIYYTLDGSDPKPYDTGTYTDVRDGKVYKTVLLPDGKWWFADSFRRIEGMTSYPNGGINNVPVYGGLYHQSDAISQVPAGCHLPTLSEVTDLLTACGGANTTTGSALREASALWSVPGSNTTGFSARPAGFFWAAASQYGGFGSTMTMVTATGTPDNFTLGLFKIYGNDVVSTGATYGNDAVTVRYIVDFGNVPDSLIYHTPLAITASTIVKAIAVKAGMEHSVVTSALYMIRPPVAPTIYPNTGTYQAIQLIVLYSPQGLPVRYTLDGSEPTASSPLYVQPINVVTQVTVKAKAFSGPNESPTSEATVTVSNGILPKIPSYRDRVLPYLLEQYKGDNP